MRIIELIVPDGQEDNLQVGIDGIALVRNPAHNENWLAFNSQSKVQPFEVLTDEEMNQLAQAIIELGEDEDELIQQGYRIVKVREIGPDYKFTGNINSDPNAPSEDDGPYGRIRYKYVGPKDNKNRPFCADMMAAKKVYRIEDIQRMSDELANEEISKYSGYYDIFTWRGSYNCRHRWIELTYAPYNPEGGVAKQRIINDNNIERNLQSETPVPAENTTTTAAAENGYNALAFKMITTLDDTPLFDTIEEAEQIANIIGCHGYHIHQIEGRDYYMPCEQHPKSMETKLKFASYNDYPQAAKENACRVLRWIDEKGRDEVAGMTPTGLARANQLCKGENISEDTIARMSAFQRHKQNSTISPEFKGTPWKDKGYVAWLGWGGTQGIEWASRKLKQIRQSREDKFLYENPCRSGYIAYGTKMKDGKKVPNCIPKNSFSLDNEKMEITGAAIIPNKLIIRSSLTGEPYYVYFSEETVKRLAYKFMKEKRLDATNIEHTTKKADDTYVVESWIISDENSDKSKSLGLNYPKGTWVITMKTDSKEVWDRIKTGEYAGFSVEGYFEEKQTFTNDDLIVEQIKAIINKF